MKNRPETMDERYQKEEETIDKNIEFLHQYVTGVLDEKTIEEIKRVMRYTYKDAFEHGNDRGIKFAFAWKGGNDGKGGIPNDETD